MYTRLVESTIIAGRAKELTNIFNESILPILKLQSGFVDAVLLRSDTEPNRLIGLSFWQTKEDAERFQRNQYDKITNITRPLADGEATIRTFEVESSTIHRVAVIKAA